MPTQHQITCINKNDRLNPYERIVSVGGVNFDGTRWLLSQQQVIDDILSGRRGFYVNEAGVIVDVIVKISPYGNHYITTEADHTGRNNLLSLAECVR